MSKWRGLRTAARRENRPARPKWSMSDSKNLGLRAATGLAALDAKEAARERDDRHVRACLAAGGFCRIELIAPGRPVYVYPQGAPCP